jgi:uncharacterized C2H2 Zn-finger protein
MKFISTNKCLFCRKNFIHNINNINLNNIYTIDTQLLSQLDSIDDTDNKVLSCPRCDIVVNNRNSLIIHLDNECSKKIISCSLCTEYYHLDIIKKHPRFDKKCVNNITKTCNVCKTNIPLYLYTKHITDCPEQIIQCSYCDDIFPKKNIQNHNCEYSKLKRKILILKEINKNLISFNQEKLFQFRFQCYNLKPFIKDNILTPPSVDDINNQINDIYQFSTTFVDLTIFKDPNYLNLPKYNIYT